MIALLEFFLLIRSALLKVYGLNFLIECSSIYITNGILAVFVYFAVQF